MTKMMLSDSSRERHWCTYSLCRLFGERNIRPVVKETILHRISGENVRFCLTALPRSPALGDVSTPTRLRTQTAASRRVVLSALTTYLLTVRQQSHNQNLFAQVDQDTNLGAPARFHGPKDLVAPSRVHVVFGMARQLEKEDVRQPTGAVPTLRRR